MTGDRIARMLLMKDSNKAIHLFVLRNRQLTSDEVRIMASYRNINPDALQRIAQNQEWMRDQRIVAALVANPKTPPQVAMRLVERLPVAEIRRLARSADAPKAVQRAARQKLQTT
jgi:pentose-5-phosphate-3-epimerase